MSASTKPYQITKRQYVTPNQLGYQIKIKLSCRTQLRSSLEDTLIAVFSPQIPSFLTIWIHQRFKMIKNWRQNRKQLRLITFRQWVKLQKNFKAYLSVKLWKCVDLPNTLLRQLPHQLQTLIDQTPIIQNQRQTPHFWLTKVTTEIIQIINTSKAAVDSSLWITDLQRDFLNRLTWTRVWSRF